MLGNSIIRRAGALPKEPTTAPPGSEEKIRVMTERAARREQLFHPLDGPGYRGRPPDLEENPADWPFDLAGEQAELPIPEDEDFDEDEGEIAVLEAPALCAWTEPVQPPELAEAPINQSDPQPLPAGSSG